MRYVAQCRLRAGMAQPMRDELMPMPPICWLLMITCLLRDITRSLPIRASGCKPSSLLRDITPGCKAPCWLGIISRSPGLLVSTCHLRHVATRDLGRVRTRGRAGRRDAKMLETNQTGGRESGSEASERRARLIKRNSSSISLFSAARFRFFQKGAPQLPGNQPGPATLNLGQRRIVGCLASPHHRWPTPRSDQGEENCKSERFMYKACMRDTCLSQAFLRKTRPKEKLDCLGPTDGPVPVLISKTEKMRDQNGIELDLHCLSCFLPMLH